MYITEVKRAGRAHGIHGSGLHIHGSEYQFKNFQLYLGTSISCREIYQSRSSYTFPVGIPQISVEGGLGVLLTNLLSNPNPLLRHCSHVSFFY